MENAAAAKAQTIKDKYSGEDVSGLMRGLLFDVFPERIALVSSFGAESAVLLYFAAQASPDFPIIFLDTMKLFPETLEYRETLVQKLGLRNVKTIYPDYNDIARKDPDGTLWQRDPRHCCNIRKVVPLAKALKGYDAWITGRKQYHGGIRTNLPFVEVSDGRVKINPLAEWPMGAVERFLEEKGLPQHPLTAQGYTSIGCAPCTIKPLDASDVRSGRWAGQDKQECGIHLGEDGKFRPLRDAGSS